MASGSSIIPTSNSYTRLVDLKVPIRNENPSDLIRSARSRLGGMDDSTGYEKKLIQGEAGYVLEDVPHLTDHLGDLPVSN